MIEKSKARWVLLKEAWPYLLHPNRILYLRDLVNVYHESIDHYTAETWKDEVVQGLKQELDARKAAMDEEEQAHEAAEEELQFELNFWREVHENDKKAARTLGLKNDCLTEQIVDLKQELAKAKADRASALAEKAYLLAEKAEWLKEGDPYRVPSETTPADC